MNLASPKTKLNSRTLWYDGDSTISSSEVEKFLRSGSLEGIFVDQITNEIRNFNKLVPKKERLLLKKEVSALDFSWNIPQKYFDVDLVNYIVDKLMDKADKYNFSEDELDKRMQRTAEELKLYEKLGLTDILRVLIYIINTLWSNDVVWGVGRGSSVSSYVLYLIGVHDVDSYKYQLDINDFLR